MSNIDYIVNSDKPYPAWIKEHRVFKSLKKIDKVWPQIGLSNFTEGITVYSLDSAKYQAGQFLYYIRSNMSSYVSELASLNWRALDATPSRERNERCNSLQNIKNIVGAIYTPLTVKECVSIVDNKVALLYPCDVFSGNSATPIIKKGETLFKVINKVNTLLAEAEPTYKINYEQNNSFKEFSKFNIPNKLYKMTFSSSGPEGAWDIATASMRGIVSCQAWTAAQSRGLIGSISSRYVGIVYVSGNTDYPPYGKQMLFRAMVRLVINRVTGIPAIFLDTIYPSYNADIYASIKNMLETRSGLKVLASQAGDQGLVMRDYYLPDELSRSFLREGEYSYMDSQIKIEKRRVPILFDSENKTLLKRQSFFMDKMEKNILSKRKICAKNAEEMKKFLASGEKDESKKPEMVPAFQDLKKGRYSFQNTLNFFAHCEQGHGTTSKPTSYFLNEIFKVLGNADAEFRSDKECDIWMLRNLINNFSSIKDKSWEVISTGSWMKAFPATSKRFHETILLELKKELYASYKGIA